MSFLEKTGGALPTAPAPTQQKKRPVVTRVERHSHVDIHRYKDTPAKKAYRELDQFWTPLYNGQEVPDFRLMREIIENHDDTEFETEEREFPLPEKPLTGEGYMKHDRETSHFTQETLRRIDGVEEIVNQLKVNWA